VTLNQHLLGVGDLSAPGFDALLDLAALMKRHPLAWRRALDGRAVACLFALPSTRSCVSLEVAVRALVTGEWEV
jgi:ornithine carbamoyltransferase